MCVCATACSESQCLKVIVRWKMYVSTFDDLQDVLHCEATLLAYVQCNNLIINDLQCSKCGHAMTFTVSDFKFRCHRFEPVALRKKGKKRCAFKITSRRKSFFAGSHLEIGTILKMFINVYKCMFINMLSRKLS